MDVYHLAGSVTERAVLSKQSDDPEFPEHLNACLLSTIHIKF